MANEYTNDGKLILRDSQGTQMSMYRWFMLSLVPRPNADDGSNLSTPRSPYGTWGGYSPSHGGYDFSGDEGITVIRSICEGEVKTAGWSDSAGYWVQVQETRPEGYEIRIHDYMHMSQSPSVAVGDIVKQGTKLGLVGNTGNSDGAHLHYQIRIGSSSASSVDAWLQFDNSTQGEGWTPAVMGANWNDGTPNDRWPLINDTNGIDYGEGNAPDPEVGTYTYYTYSLVQNLITFTPEPGMFATGLEIEFNSSVSGVYIFYTTDGSVPTTDSKKISSGGKIKINRSTHIRARVFDSADTVVAKASGTFIRAWDSLQWEAGKHNEYAKNLKSENNIQPYLTYSDGTDRNIEPWVPTTEDELSNDII